ncbi:hypothetical protein [uncultured Campylobacter sp.]|uniref:hypothetical protein n=1 Tax=uncultured Campylobacter sp. TaxID=218934 RepID=UPI002624CA31|nr:hypothetical protein [uncultured Campylobacter sp.]
MPKEYAIRAIPLFFGFPPVGQIFPPVGQIFPPVGISFFGKKYEKLNKFVSFFGKMVYNAFQIFV